MGRPGYTRNQKHFYICWNPGGEETGKNRAGISEQKEPAGASRICQDGIEVYREENRSLEKKGDYHDERERYEVHFQKICKPGDAVHFFSRQEVSTWRKLWIALAESERELGLPVTEEQIAELKAHAEDINYDVAQERERQSAMT